MADPYERPQGPLADQSQIDRKANKVQEDRALRELVIRTLMQNVGGRRYVWQELEYAQVFHQTLDCGPGGFAKTAFNEGKRSVGLRLLGEVTRLCPEEYMLMTRENAKEAFVVNGEKNG